MALCTECQHHTKAQCCQGRWWQQVPRSQLLTLRKQMQRNPKQPSEPKFLIKYHWRFSCKPFHTKAWGRCAEHQEAPLECGCDYSAFNQEKGRSVPTGMTTSGQGNQTQDGLEEDRACSDNTHHSSQSPTHGFLLVSKFLLRLHWSSSLGDLKCSSTIRL